LRVLEQREFMRVGGTETISVDIRLIAATNQDLEAAVEEGRLRSDLYYRLKVVTIKIPPLREREGDIPLLANHFLRTFAAENGRGEMRFNPDAMAMLVRTRWDGNVRELRNLVESLVVLAPGDEIGIDDLPPEYRGAIEEPAGEPTAEGRPGEGPAGEPRGETMDEIERRAILAALEKTGGNRTQAAEMLGIGLRTLQRKLKEYRMAGKAEGV
jgi:DNA-binding NtrC family response regulator